MAALALISGLAAYTAAAGSSAALPAYVCGTQSGGSTTVYGHVTDVRVGAHRTFDRFVIEFSNARLPHYTITPKSSSVFVLDPSGRQVTLLGSAGLKIVMHTATGVGTYGGPADFRPRFPQLREARRLGDFEGYLSWGLGLAHQSCKRVFTLSSPRRLIIDVPH
jgi:hypothetical protein